MADSDSAPLIDDLSETVISSDRLSVEFDPVDIHSIDHPSRIDRYEIIDLLGKGGYGLVYLANDERLKRQVAIKVPHPNFVSKPDAAEAYLKEARTVANLDHPNIVPVYDFGSVEAFPCFIVSKYIEGTNLTIGMERARLSYGVCSELVATVAEALDYAHDQGLVHRDIKPGNILLDTHRNPYLTDFGLALREQDYGHGKRYVGTASYMSPEQASGEGHRVDPRSDIFSLGIVLYQLLSGTRPYTGNSREEILRRIIRDDPRPVWQVDQNVPRDLAHVCHKAMAKRVGDRYSSAREFAEDLRGCLGEMETRSSTGSSTGSFATGLNEGTDSRDETTLVAPIHLDSAGSTTRYSRFWETSSPARVIPKGLRSFDAHDAEFYLDLLPGPRDRHGLPDGVRFWKHAIEETDPDETFPIGVIYGPSGCGKSSLIKAGVLPRLRDDVCAVYTEATGSGLESRLMHLIAKAIPHLDSELGLKETLAAIRRGGGLASDQKLLIVIDQFEQWLHAHHDVENEDLLTALRQCDGGRVQCIVMVRDDFWLAVSRFAQALEVRLEDGQNSALVDLVDMQHARKVLAAFGVAYGKLPESLSEMTEQQRAFLKQAVAGIAQEGRVSCIRLSLLADMMKNRNWTTDGLRHVGGTMGIGEAFLEETFSGPTAPPAHRYHAQAARAVLKALLPERGTGIKGQMVSRKELRWVSGYANRDQDFGELLKILDGQLRLISPVDSYGITDGSTESPSSDQDIDQHEDGTKEFYQLTHDYLVDSLWQWLTRKQQESRRGRAEIRLSERTALWSSRPETRQLPSFVEYLNIRLFTRPPAWSQQERQMLRSAARYHWLHKGFLALLFVLIGLGTWQFIDSVRSRQASVELKLRRQAGLNGAVTLVQRLRDADVQTLPMILEDLDQHRPWADRLIRDGFSQAASGSRQKLNLAIAAIVIGPSQSDDAVKYAAQSLSQLDPDGFHIALDALLPHRQEASRPLWRKAADPSFVQTEVMPTAIALAALDPDNPGWVSLAPRAARELSEISNPTRSLAKLKPIAPQLADPLRQILNANATPNSQRRRAAIALCGILTVDQQIAESLPDAIVRWILETNSPSEFSAMLESLRPHSYGVRRQMEQVLAESEDPIASVPFLNAATVLMHFGDDQMVWPLLQHSPNPTIRNQLIDRLSRYHVSNKLLLDHLAIQQNTSVRQAIVLILGAADIGEILAQHPDAIAALRKAYLDDSDSGVHSAIAWTLRRWQLNGLLHDLNLDLAERLGGRLENDFNWTVNAIGQTYIQVSPPAEFVQGDTSRGGSLRPARIDYRFAIAANEVSVAEFKRFREEYAPNKRYAPSADCPASEVSWYDAIAFCNWLSDREGLRRCYEPNDESNYAAGVRIPEDFLQRDGYRLPTELELECLSRAGTETNYSFGTAGGLLGNYAWYEKNARNRTWPVGTKLPNALGAFDTHGNLWEWSHDLKDVSKRGSDRVVIDRDARLLCGGAFDNKPDRVESGDRLVHYPYELKYSYGFRPARTLPQTQ